MKIIAILGSPRKNGNSATIARRVLSTAQELGAETEEFMLNKMSFKGCQACMGCKKTGHCVVQDDLIPVLDAFRTADAIVLASPVYWFDVSGQFKCFFDRLYSFSNLDGSTNLPTGKKAVMILTQADGPEFYTDIYTRYSEGLVKWLGFEQSTQIRCANADAAGEALNRPEILSQAEEIGRRLMQM